MKMAIKVFLIFTFLLLQNTALSGLRIFGTYPNLPLLLVVFVALKYDLRLALIIGLLSGVLNELLFSEYIGLSIFTYLALIYLISKIDEETRRKKMFYPICITTGTVLYYLFFSFFGFFLGFREGLTLMFRVIVIKELLVNLLVAIPLHFVFSFIDSALKTNKGGKITRWGR